MGFRAFLGKRRLEKNVVSYWRSKGAKIGENCEIYPTVSLGSEPYLITIGDHVRINSNVNLIFSGHAHGGQFRLPFIGGLIAPDQGFFPKLTEGIHTSNDTSMIISRGLGNSIIPVRILNRPELIVVTLSK